MEKIVLIIALGASFIFAASAGYLRFRYERKKDRMIAAIFSLVFALLCLVGIIISRINRSENYRSDYEKTVSIYEETERAKNK